MSAYLDNAATTQCLPEAAEVMQRVLTADYGNPSSLHSKGMEAEQYIKSARRTVAASLKAQEKEIIFTSGGTESNNLAIFGAARAKRRQGRHIITTMIEHPSVHNAVAALEEEGCEVTYLPVDHNGVFPPEMLASSLRPDTVLVTVMHVNNEIGTIEPIEEAAQIVHEGAPKALFHVDAIQSYGKLPVYPKRIGVDLLSVSGHKLHGPKGSGFLFVREGVHILPLQYGGGQSRRSGTENVPAIAGLGVAVEALFERQQENREHLYACKERFVEGVRDIPGIRFNGHTGKASAPHIVSISVKDVRAEVMLHALEERGVFVSAGSACSSNRPAKSRTLLAIGAKDERIASTIRFSFSVHTTADEIDQAIEAIRELAPALSRFRRK